MHWRACVGCAKPRTGRRPVKGKATSATSSSGETVSAGEGMHGVGGDRMAGSWSDMNQGSLFGKGTLAVAGKGFARSESAKNIGARVGRIIEHSQHAAVL